MMSGKTWFLIGLPVVVLIVAVIYMYKIRKGSKLELVSLAMVLAGGIGNLIDRIRVKEVVDYIKFEPINFPIFNFADICIVIGGILFVICFCFLDEKKKPILDRLTVQRQVICHGKLYELVGGNENCHDNKRNYKHLFPTPFMNSKALRKTEP